MTGENGTVINVKEVEHREAGNTCCDVQSKRETQTSTPSLSTLKRVLGFPRDAKAVRQSELVDCAVMNSANVCISVFSLFLTPFITQTSAIQGTNRPWGSSINLRLGISVLGAPAKHP